MKVIIKFLRAGCCGALILILVGSAAFSQENIEVKTTQAQMSKGMQTCYVVEIPQAELKTVQQNWIKKLQEGSKIKVKEINEELVMPGVVKMEFTKDTVNIFSILIQKDSSIFLNVFVEIDSVFFAPKEDKADLANDKIDSSIKNYTRSFAVEQYKLAVTDELEGQQKVLESLEDDLKKLEKEEENLGKDNSTLENEIDKTEREISDIEKQIELKNKEILDHNVSMQNIGLEADKKAAEDKKKDLEKEKKQLEKERTKAKDEVSSDKSQIEKNKKAIEDSKEQQVAKQDEITKQNEVIAKVQTKLNGIK
jgi:uncharacterized protein